MTRDEVFTHSIKESNMYVALTIVDRDVDAVMTFEEFPVFIEGYGTANSVQEVRDAYKADLEDEVTQSYIEIREVKSPNSTLSKLQNALNWHRDVLKSRGARNLWLRTSDFLGEVKGYIIFSWPKNEVIEDSAFEVQFDDEGQIIHSDIVDYP